ncbi:hypothetical protein CRUP_007909 [Coryphaenoides rupestris]|nr:hypothetical protein CRUP_007909 [Coryphaenoides rupestris]
MVTVLLPSPSGVVDSPGHQHIVAVGLGAQAVQHRQADLGLVPAVGLQLAGQQADLLGQLLHRLGGLRPRDLDAAQGNFDRAITSHQHHRLPLRGNSCVATFTVRSLKVNRKMAGKVVDEVSRLNEDPRVHGVYLHLPPSLLTRRVLGTLAPEKDVVDEVSRLNEDPRVHGVYLHLPPSLLTRRVLGTLAPEKDVDG